MTSLSLEFDASSFKTRVRKGLLEADAKYHVLAFQLNIGFNFQVLTNEMVLVCDSGSAWNDRFGEHTSSLTTHYGTMKCFMNIYIYIYGDEIMTGVVTN